MIKMGSYLKKALNPSSVHFVKSMQNLNERVKKVNTEQCGVGEELDLLKDILVKCIKDLDFLTCGTFRQWLWLVHKQLILEKTLC